MTALRAALAWSQPFRAAYASVCHLCGREVSAGEQVSILCRLETEHGESTVLGHACCMRLDTPGWRSQVLPAEVDLRLAELRALDAGSRVAELEAEVARLRSANDQYRARLQALRMREPLAYEMTGT